MFLIRTLLGELALTAVGWWTAGCYPSTPPHDAENDASRHRTTQYLSQLSVSEQHALLVLPSIGSNEGTRCCAKLLYTGRRYAKRNHFEPMARGEVEKQSPPRIEPGMCTTRNCLWDSTPTPPRTIALRHSTKPDDTMAYFLQVSTRSVHPEDAPLRDKTMADLTTHY